MQLQQIQLCKGKKTLQDQEEKWKDKNSIFIENRLNKKETKSEAQQLPVNMNSVEEEFKMKVEEGMKKTWQDKWKLKVENDQMQIYIKDKQKK